MKPRPLIRTLTLLALAASLASVGIAGPQTPSTKGSESPSVWSTGQPAAKPARRARRKPRATPKPAVSVPDRAPLTLQWRVLKRSPDGATQVEVSPRAIFYPGDQLRLGFTANEDGYLWILTQSDGLDGSVVRPPSLLFPSSRINQGRNFVQKGQEYIIPSSCTDFANPGDCWLDVLRPAGRQVLVVVFSRDLASDVPDRILGGGPLKLQNGLPADGELRAHYRTSRPNRPPSEGGGAGRYITWSVNQSPTDSVLVDTIIINHRE